MTTVEATDARATFERELEPFRVELRAYCYRMLGSPFDAEDAVQDALVRAWRHVDGYEGRAALRSWLYRIATNVCLDVIARRKRRELPTSVSAAGRGTDALGPSLEDFPWIEPASDGWVLPADADPAEQAVLRDSVRLAFVAALQVLPPRQRAALILREVLSWRPPEIADLLETSVASVNSALQRARRTLATVDVERHTQVEPASAELLERYVEAFEAFDLDALVALLREDAVWDMPPFELWFQGADDIRTWLERKPCDVARYVPIPINGGPGVAMYATTATPGRYEAYGVQSLVVRDGRIAAVHTFLDPRLVPLFGLSPTLVV